jgi:hypothetical protein
VPELGASIPSFAASFAFSIAINRLKIG